MSRDGIEPSHNGFQPSALPLSYPDNNVLFYRNDLFGDDRNQTNTSCMQNKCANH